MFTQLDNALWQFMSVFQYTYQICNMFRTQLFKQFYDCYISHKKFQIDHHLHCDSCFDITCPLYKSIPCFLALTSHILFVSLYSYALRKNNKFFLLILCNMRKLILILVTAEKSFLQTRISPCMAWHETEKLQYSTNEQTSQYGT